MKKFSTIIIILLLIIIAWFIFGTKTENKTQTKTQTIADKKIGKLELISENDFDFGEILMKGGDVNYNYTLKNTGDAPISITNAETSCACTIANIFNADGDKIGPFGMQGGGHSANPKINMLVLPGEEITVEAIYDPLKHGPDATGKLVREIFISTDSKQEIALKFRGEGVKEFSKINGPALAFTNKEYDFGLTKQSGGFFETKFELINNGTETVLIDSLPASCQCVIAAIDKESILPGETATITVTFDANLHPEPEGRFFKTIEVISNVKPSPELKIFAKVDYDLGMDKLKLATHDNSDGHHDANFQSISATNLKEMLINKDFTLIDVHIPEQEHIPGTDYMISYDEIDKITAVIPNKDSKVVLYCRSGSMSKQTAKALVEKGYTNIYELENGLNEWVSEGGDTLSKGSIKNI